MAFQTFDPPKANAGDVAARVAALRDTFDALNIDGVLVPHEDAYQSEYLPPSEERLAFITGFTGSAGRAIILSDAALLATDGRYALQAASQAPGDIFAISSEDETAKDWMKAHLGKGLRLGIDPQLHSRAAIKRLKAAAPGVEWVRLASHPVDDVWADRPSPPKAPIRLHDEALAGRTAAEKLTLLREAMTEDAVFIAASDSVSWLLNWRGGDVDHTPLVLSRAFVPKTGKITVFVDDEKRTNAVVSALEPLGETTAASTYLERLTALSSGLSVQADPQLTSDTALAAIEAGGTLVEKADPSLRLKAIKTEAEMAGARAAHLRDGRAVTRFLAWFENNAVGASEIDLVRRLEAFRRGEGAVDVSFPTIAGAGPNGAIIHYRVDESTNRTVAANDPVLIDSGAQYEDGTTDITRTVVAGEASEDFCIQFTRVLKGHIAIAMARFPERTVGAQLDTLARTALWQSGFDFAHGTGHGIGAYLSVHEGPQGISKRSQEPLAAGMIVSNEPGYYRTDAYGIRIENCLLIRSATVPPGGEVAMHRFEDLTLVPIDTRLVVPSLLTAAEIGWLDAYHARVRGALSGSLNKDERAFLERRTRPLASGEVV
ncbi:MAG: aminopeptidase P family protein [Devosia sp.]